MSAGWGFSRRFDDNALQPAISSGRIFGNPSFTGLGKSTPLIRTGRKRDNLWVQRP
jgi:hypothetical protein